MKTTNLVNLLPSAMVRFFLITLCVFVPLQLSHAQNKVVVIPLFGDDTPQEPTAPVAKVDPSQTDYTFGNFIVTDEITKLQWQRQVDSTERDWFTAYDYCADLTYGNQTDWRLPDIVELLSIVDYGQINPSIDGVVFPNNNSSSYWSASSWPSSSSRAWIVDFFFGVAINNFRVTDNFVRCVR